MSETEKQEEVNISDSLDDDLSEIFDKLEEEDNGDEQSEQEDSGDSSEPEAEAEGSSAEGDGEVAESEASAGEESSSEESSNEGSEEESEEEEPEDPELANAPPSWSAEAKEQWGDMSPRARQEVLKREGDRENEYVRNKSLIDSAVAMEKIITPYMATINAAGSTPEKAIQSVLNTQYQLMNANPQQKAYLLLQAAQQYGADMSVLTQPLEQQDPQIAQLNHQMMQMQNQIQTQNQSVESSQSQGLEQAVDTFSNQVNEDNTLKYPYFNNVSMIMADNIPRLRNDNPGMDTSQILEKAYNSAIWSHDETRTLLQKQKTDESVSKTQKEAKERTEKAKKAQKLNLQKKPAHSSKTDEPQGSIDETMNSTYDKLNSG